MNNQSSPEPQELPELPESPDTLEELSIALLSGAVGSIPVVGGILSGIFETSLRMGNAKKTHRVLEYVLHEVNQLKLDHVSLVEYLTQDEEFIDYLNRALWSSRETSEDGKLRAISVAAAHSGSWSPIKDAEREFYWRLIEEYNAIHFQTLRVLHLGVSPHFDRDVQIVLDDFFKSEIGFPAHYEDIGNATLGDLYRDGLVTDNFGLGFSLVQGKSQLSTLGGDFLNFITESATKLD